MLVYMHDFVSKLVLITAMINNQFDCYAKSNHNCINLCVKLEI